MNQKVPARSLHAIMLAVLAMSSTLVAAMPAASASVAPLTVRQVSEVQFLEAAYGYSTATSSEIIRGLNAHGVDLPTIQMYRNHEVIVPGEAVPKASTVAAARVTSSTATLVAAAGMAPAAGTTSSRYYAHCYTMHDGYSWNYDTWFRGCLHWRGTTRVGANSYNSQAWGHAVGGVVSWAVGYYYDTLADHWIDHGQTYGHYPWVRYNAIGKFHWGWGPFGQTFNLCVHPYGFANGHVGNSGHGCWVN